MKVLVGAFNQEKALVGAFSVIVQPVVEPMEHYTALACTDPPPRRLLLGPRHILPVLQLDLASSLVEVS